MLPGARVTSRSLVPAWIDGPLKRYQIHWFDRVQTVEVSGPVQEETRRQINSLKHLSEFTLRGQPYALAAPPQDGNRQT